MGRRSRYDEADILEGAKHVSAALGPQKLTIARVAARTGVPVGSIYHRYTSRDEILAAVWLDLAEEFQGRWLAALAAQDAMKAGVAAIRYGCRWIREHPREARLLLLHRREDFAAERWPASYRRRADQLAHDAVAALMGYAARLTGRTGRTDLRLVRFALVDVPTAALRCDVESGETPSNETEQLLVGTGAYVLRRAARTAVTRRTRR